jgi:antitoxin component YwqK of YwqJK toxin-antitoxin module
MRLFFKSKSLNSYIIFIQIILIVILTIILFHGPYDDPSVNHYLGKKIIVINDGLIYQKGESLPFTGRILDTLEKKTIIEYDVVNGQKNGEFFLSTLDGIYTVHGFTSNNKNVGTWQYYYENGQLECKGDFNDDKPTGKWVWYYKNGVKKSEGIFIKGKPEGKWIQYDKSGYTKLIIKYNAGELLSIVEIFKPKLI